MEKKILTDADVKRKGVKLVIAHARKKIDREFEGQEQVFEWIESVEELLTKEEFNKSEYIEKRKEFNDVIERTIDAEMRIKLRDSWISMGKALDKKVKKDR